MARYLNEPAILLFTAAAITALWLLDAKYLQTERSFRELYDETRTLDAGETASFELAPGKVNWIPGRELVSWSTSLLYIPMLALLGIIWCLLDA